MKLNTQEVNVQGEIRLFAAFWALLVIWQGIYIIGNVKASHEREAKSLTFGVHRCGDGLLKTAKTSHQWSRLTIKSTRFILMYCSQVLREDPRSVQRRCILK